MKYKNAQFDVFGQITEKERKGKRKGKCSHTRKLDPSGCKRRYDPCGDVMTPYACRKQLTLACTHRL